MLTTHLLLRTDWARKRPVNLSFHLYHKLHDGRDLEPRAPKDFGAPGAKPKLALWQFVRVVMRQGFHIKVDQTEAKHRSGSSGGDRITEVLQEPPGTPRGRSGDWNGACPSCQTSTSSRVGLNEMMGDCENGFPGDPEEVQKESVSLWI